LSFGLGFSGSGLSVYSGRLLFAFAIVGLLDFFIADPGKYREFRDREKRSREKARAVAHIQGKELYGLIREDAISIIEAAAKKYQVEIKSREISDYIHALREANSSLQKLNLTLFTALREITKIYPVSGSAKKA